MEEKNGLILFVRLRSRWFMEIIGQWPDRLGIKSRRHPQSLTANGCPNYNWPSYRNHRAERGPSVCPRRQGKQGNSGTEISLKGKDMPNRAILIVEGQVFWCISAYAHGLVK